MQRARADPPQPSGPWPLRAGPGPANTGPALALEVRARAGPRAEVLRPCPWTVYPRLEEPCDVTSEELDTRYEGGRAPDNIPVVTQRWGGMV